MFIILISLIANFLYASDYYVIEDTNVFIYTNRVRDYITKNTKIDIRSVYCSSIYDGTYLAEIYDSKYIRLDNVINKSLTTYLPDEFLASHSYEKSLYLFPSYVIDAVKKQDRNYLKKYESKNISRMTVDDGDYLSVYVEDEKNPRETYCYVDNNFRVELEKLLKNNVCDLRNVTWPRHEDGSCDYEKEKTLTE